MKFVRFIILIPLLVCLSIVSARATHLRAGDITLTRLSPFGYSYSVTLHVYTKSSARVKFGGGTLNFGDNTEIITDARPDPPVISNVDTGVGYVEYTVTHTFPGPGSYVITYLEQNRNGGILNLGGSGSDQIPFFIQTRILIDDFLPGGADNTPQLLVPPIDMGCTGVAWFHNPGAYDLDGDSLSYKLFVPKKGEIKDDQGYYASSVDAPYQSPVSPAFSQVTELGASPPIFKIDSLTGTITWDSPGRAGEYNIAFIIEEWRKVDGVWVSLGYVERDMQIIIQDCQNNRPKIQGVPDVCVTAEDPTMNPVVGDFFATDPAVNPGGRTTGDGTAVKLEAYSQIFSINPSPATYTPFPATWQPIVNDADQAHLQVNWNTVCAHVKEQPYEVVVKATDNGSPNLATFESWKINVVAPEPTLLSATLDSVNRLAKIKWQKYKCNNASLIQVWRRVDSAPYTKINCVTGMPSYLGYKLIALVPHDSVGYTDKNLASGASYCYRLVALFPQPNGGVSYVSNEKCIPPLATKAPMITNVTIDVTNSTAGQITVKWQRPLKVNKTDTLYYEVLRAEGFSGAISQVHAYPGKKPDTVLVDLGLNTAQNIYNYRVLAYDKSGNFLDSSSIASTVRLDLKPTFKEIQLNWFANVPWSNISPKYPMHVIYRTTNSAAQTVTAADIIDTVFVDKSEFVYIDQGQYNNTPLDSTQTYCYAVMTQGSYGNPKIVEPLINFSEITCAVPNVQEKPCVPVLSLKGYNCNGYSDCPVTGNKYSNQVMWRKPSDVNCKNEVLGYNVYAANSVGDSFVKINTELVRDTFYVHSGLQSYAQCYKVSAVGRSGLESELSGQFCFDNCPFYELPNVFTPNGDKCNDTFSAYSIRHYGDPDEGYPCGNTNPNVEALRKQCARFVLSVQINIYNRWGRQVYTYQGSVNDPDTSPGIYIDWNGKDSDGRDLDGGVYYYAANVIFDVVDPKKRNQTIKGWVQIIR